MAMTGINNGFLNLTGANKGIAPQQINKKIESAKFLPLKNAQNINTNPYKDRGLFANIEELEKRTATYQGRFEGINPEENKVATVPIENKGALWGVDFKVPANNGTGDLIPKVDNDELRTITMA